jgi:hypothetical protein
MSKSPKAGRSPKQGLAGFPGIKLVMLFALIAVVGAVVFLTGTKSSNASPKKYKATREIVVDQQTGQRRMPTQEEIDQVVSNLSQLANRPEDLPATQGAAGAETVDLAGGYNGVVLARPADDGSMETKCVFTFEEGAEFLGLVEDTSAE